MISGIGERPAIAHWKHFGLRAFTSGSVCVGPRGSTAILAALKDIRGGQRVTDQNPEDKYQALERYGRDLTEMARKGKLDPVIGRDDEVRRVYLGEHFRM